MARIVSRVERSQWRVLRQVRLRALLDAPYAFGSTYAAELARGEDWWTASAERLAWFIASEDGESVGLIAALSATSEDPGCRAVISMWAAPAQRGTGAALDLLAAVRRWAVDDGAVALSLRVAGTNDRARRFYDRLGFVPTGDQEPLRSNPADSAGEFRLTLGQPAIPAEGANPPGRARLRFAPSPAGDLHVGHVRTAVLTWIVAQQQAGGYFVRFENTDRAKEVPGSREAILADLAWLGLLGNEPPHDQAEMTTAHRAALDRLSARGHVYDDGGAIRFRMPSEGTVDWHDLVRGPITVANDELNDPVLVRHSGQPTFYLASTVDDIEDGITHLVRADPLRRATATQIHIWRSLGVDPPSVGHVPLVTGPRRAPVRFGVGGASIRELREGGISPLAVLIYLAMPETASWKRPPASFQEVADRLDLRRLPRRPTTFEPQALNSLNRRLRGRVS